MPNGTPPLIVKYNSQIIFVIIAKNLYLCPKFGIN